MILRYHHKRRDRRLQLPTHQTDTVRIRQAATLICPLTQHGPLHCGQRSGRARVERPLETTRVCEIGRRARGLQSFPVVLQMPTKRVRRRDIMYGKRKRIELHCSLEGARRGCDSLRHLRASLRAQCSECEAQNFFEDGIEVQRSPSIGLGAPSRTSFRLQIFKTVISAPPCWTNTCARGRM